VSLSIGSRTSGIRKEKLDERACAGYLTEEWNYIFNLHLRSEFNGHAE
jgi:hypothetical protein